MLDFDGKDTIINVENQTIVYESRTQNDFTSREPSLLMTVKIG